MSYAHARIEVREDDDSVTVYERGEEVPDSIPGYDELVDGGAISDDEYDPAVDISGPPNYVEIDGVRYEKVSEDA